MREEAARAIAAALIGDTGKIREKAHAIAKTITLELGTMNPVRAVPVLSTASALAIATQPYMIMRAGGGAMLRDEERVASSVTAGCADLVESVARTLTLSTNTAAPLPKLLSGTEVRAAHEVLERVEAALAETSVDLQLVRGVVALKTLLTPQPSTPPEGVHGLSAEEALQAARRDFGVVA